MKFEERIQALRKEKGLSQEELAEKLGISRQAVAKWESGLSYPDVDNLIILSGIFHISIDEMLKPQDECSKTISKDNGSSCTVLSRKDIEFLCRAKKNTYASNGGTITPTRPNSHDLRYQEADYVYMDTYLGGERFSGEEALWIKEIPTWAMNYTGRVIGDGFSGDFLKEALSKVPMELPYRGPRIYRDGDYTYHCVVHGDIEWFQGYEEIFLFSEKIFECYFHGGIVKQ